MSSSRRGGNEESILAMLERDGRGIGRRLPSGTRLMWYGGGSVLVVGLVGLLVWLAHGSTEQQQVDAIAMAAPLEASAAPVAAHKTEPPAPSVHPAAAIVEEPAAAPEAHPLPTVSPPSAAPADEASETQGAAVVQDDAPAARSLALVENDPLAAPSEQAAPEDVKPSTHMGTAHEMMDTASAHLAAAHDKNQAAAAAPRRVPPAAVVAKAQVKHTPKATRHERARARAKAPGAHSGRHSAARASKKRKAQPIQQAVATPADSDVALISAVIRHANYNDAAEATCDCAEKATHKQ